MHPAVCAAVSALSYEGRLCSTGLTRRAPPRQVSPGVHTRGVHRKGNSIRKPRGQAILAELRQLLGSPWTDEHGTRPLAASDVACSRRTTPRWRWSVGGWRLPDSGG
ncbi:hypothetical protein ABLN97_01090 [Mycobacterium tuberculosis]